MVIFDICNVIQDNCIRKYKCIIDIIQFQDNFMSYYRDFLEKIDYDPPEPFISWKHIN